MVSWFRFLDAHWSDLEHQLRPNGGHSAAIRTHESFRAIKAAPSDEIETGFKTWLKDSKDCPGVLMVVRGKSNSNKGMVDTIHHLKQVKDKTNVAVVMGVDGLSYVTTMVGVPLLDLFGDLCVIKKTRSAAMKDWYIPTIEGLMEDRHPIADKFAPRILDECEQVDSIRQWPNSMFVPFPIVEMIWSVESDEEDEEPLPLEAGSVPPRALLLRLVAGARLKKENQPRWFMEWRGVIQNVVTFLWAHVLDLSLGNHVVALNGNRNWNKHAVRCSHELLEFTEGLDGESSSSSNDGEEEKVSTRFQIARGGRRGGTRRESTEDVRMGVAATSPRIRAQPTRRGKNLSDQRSTNTSDSEAEELVGVRRAALRKSAETVLPPPPRGIPQPAPAPAPEHAVPTEAMPPGAEDWAKRLLQGILASTKAMQKAGDSMHEFAIVNKNNIEKKDEKKKATSRWLPSAVFLFQVLSAEDGWFTTGVPELTEFAEQITEMKIFQATQLIRDKAKEEGWPGGILKAGISDFLKRGFMAEDIQLAPSGFSILFFHPSGYSETDGKEFRFQQGREVFGKGEMPDEVIKALSSQQIFVPENTYQAADQIRTAVKFLECLCGDRTIATSGYKFGLRMIEENRRIFDSETSLDPIFLLNYMYMLDRVFQAFCKELRRFEKEPDPIQEASAVVGDGWMEKMIAEPIQKWVIQGQIPIFASPLILRGKSPSKGVMDLSEAGKKQGVAIGAGAPIGGAPRQGRKAGRQVPLLPDGNSPLWHSELSSDECVKDWRLPSGKKLADFFGPHKKENLVGLLKVMHHKSGRPAQPCLRYQLEKCRQGAGCPFAHIRPKDIPRDIHDAITSHIKGVYEKENA